MKKLIYKGEEIDTLSEQEARELTNAKGLTIIFKGQRLRASQLEVMNEKSYSKERHITEYSTPECTTLQQTVAQDKAGERILEECARRRNQKLSPGLMPGRNPHIF